ncbi:hypothetical protein BC941DRAFT_425141 [Chlamydoabsidia padenii]|nr:hypothetical protein BC941DRAFT_425141 [Chlamydoabsidia padenii]
MVILSPYAARVIRKINFIGTWVSLIVCCRNFSVCYAQYKRSRGNIHLVNMAQVVVIFFHRLLYGIIPLFEITTCAFFPVLVSLWHLAYILFYVVMFQRLIILESDHHLRWIKVVGLLLIGVRFSDWPYELVVRQLSDKNNVGSSSIFAQDTCWAQWELGVLIVNFIGDAIANLFLSGMFVRRLYKHIRSTRSVTPQNKVIEYIARKSLACLILTFFVNLAMNLLKVTTFIGEYSDAFTVFFELAESTLLVEALRVDDQLKGTIGCSQCGKSSGGGRPNKRSMLPSFGGGSFDFVPLEERHGGMFRNNLDNSQSSRHVTMDTTLSSQTRRSMDITSGYTSTLSHPRDDYPKTRPPLGTLSASLVDHPEWNNDDYRMF